MNIAHARNITRPRPPALRGRVAFSSFRRPVTSAALSPPAVVFAVGLVLWAVLQPDHLVYGLSVGVPVALLGLGLLVLQGWMREISLASAGLYATSIYYFNWLHRHEQGLGWPWFAAAVATIAIPTVLMTAVAFLTRRLPAIYLIILTVGLQIALEGTVFNDGNLSGGLSGGNGLSAPLEDPRPGWLIGDTHFYFFALVWLGAALVVLTRLRRSPWGLGLYLTGANRQAAAAVGIPAIRFRIIAFALAGAFAGLAGVLGSMFYVSPPLFMSFRVQESLVLLAIPVLAGVDSMGTILLVALVLKLSPIWLSAWHIDDNYLISSALALGALFGARGFGGRSRELYRRLTQGTRAERTRAEGPDTALLRHATGSTDESLTLLHAYERDQCVALLKQWLPPQIDCGLVVDARDLKVHFDTVEALDGADLQVPAGGMVGLIGPNGAGKTTLFDVISGFQKPTSGNVVVLGDDVSTTTSWERAALGLSRTFQNGRVVEELSVGDNILAGAYTHTCRPVVSYLLGLPAAWQEMGHAEQVARAAARLLGVERYWDERVGSLEYSARRRVEIARALMAGPQLLLLDEPAAGLDPASSAILFGLIKELNRDLGLAVLLVEHYVKVVFDTCDLVYVLAEGRVLTCGTPAEVLTDPEVRELYLGALDATTWRPEPMNTPSART